MPGVLEGKIAVVTGAGRGIGRAIAEEFAAEGAKVVVASRTPRTVDEVVDRIAAAGGVALGAACDVSRRADVEAAVDTAVNAWGGVDILVNNAQSFGTRDNPELRSPNSPIDSVSEDEWDWVYATGLKGTLYAMQAAFPHMKARGGGSVFNFGSARGILSTPGTGAYNATKEAIRGLSRTAANEWGAYNIRVNVINPVIDTDAYRADVPTEEMHQLTLGMIPLGKLGRPREAARVAVFLAGPDASYLTGMVFSVDGGMTSRP
jgi:NAD(P)-dependent dehydrogenase (short-subunit alcohol dehydrogenase family)